MKLNIEAVNNFLSKLSVLDYKYRLLEKDKEQFNIFTALHKERDEVRLHSRFISVLLSPESKHNKNHTFLKLFLKTLSIENFDIENAKVYPNEYQKSEFNEIDILIINRISKQAIIIENKIDAGDSNHEDRGQLEGYFELIHKLENIPKENIKVFYLTLDGHLPSSGSLGKYEILEKINGRTIDYEHEIQDWLALCLNECIFQPYLRESIIQYINLIKQMTNDNTNIQERLEIRSLISSSNENMISAKLLIENFKHVKWHTVMDFWEELCLELENKGFKTYSKPSKDNITNTTHYEVYKKAYESSNDYGVRFSTASGIKMYIWNGTGSNWIYWGFENKLLTDEELKIINSAIAQNPGFFQKSETGYWKYFDLNSEENIFFPDFSYKGTFDLINENHRKMIIETKLVPEISSFLQNN
jgi:hypothetical protein